MSLLEIVLLIVMGLCVIAYGIILFVKTKRKGKKKVEENGEIKEE